MKTKLFLVLAIIGLVFTFAACGDDEDGNWKPMQWSGYSKNKDIVIKLMPKVAATSFIARTTMVWEFQK